MPGSKPNQPDASGSRTASYASGGNGNQRQGNGLPREVQDGLNSQNLAFVEAMFEDFMRDPETVSPEWKHYFEELPIDERTVGGLPLRPSLPRYSLFNPPTGGVHGAASARESDIAVLQERVDQLIRNYRVRGHIIAHLDPLGQPAARPPELNPEFYGFTEADYDRTFSTTWAGGPEVRTLREILQWLQTTYCRTIGAQFMHIDSLHVRQWLQDRMEKTANHLHLTRDEQLRILHRLTDAVVFEEFVQKKFIGAKSFSLEGAESLIPLLDLAIEKAGEQGVEEIVLGMAHRGRLNVLANILGKSARDIFREFEDVDPELHSGGGDVKYHLGYSNDWKMAGGGTAHLSLCFNPSHLEYVNPVALGRMRAKQDRFGDRQRRRGLVFLIHGDAAFAGEGVVQETLNLSELTGYTVGGTVHIVVNNQIGFTTSAPEGRSTTYATDVAKMLQIPIFHVNGEDPEAVAQVVRLAMDFRATFRRDVVIDMYCYRLRGHNEGDEPSFTQPLMYRAIRERTSVRRSYLQRLVGLGGVTAEEAERVVEQRREELERELASARSTDYVHRKSTLEGVWRPYRGGPEPDEVDTSVPREQLASLLDRQTRLPDDFHPHPKIERLLTARQEMAAGERPLDWTAAEAAAFASLAAEGYPIRMSGQDSQRGTFSQRHAVLHDVEGGRTYMPLEHLAEDQARVEIYNSPLSEAGVMGFEYGYSLDCPEGLVVWEAQFGDFVNVAQVIIDQFLSSAEDKWRRLSGLVLLLPHGFEGQGPEHSSARLERFLQQAAEDNMQIVYPTTPAQYFHCLRRQVLRRWRKPLIVMTPKSLLRHRGAVSTLEECGESRFHRILADRGETPPQQIQLVLLCAGKIYYELAEHREKTGRDDVAILRIEQLYPLAPDELKTALWPYAEGTPVVWVQEEPENMGAWRYMRVQFCETLFRRWPFAGVARAESASPATGSASSHKLEQQELIERAFGRA